MTLYSPLHTARRISKKLPPARTLSIAKRVSERLNKGKVPEQYENMTWGNIAFNDDDDDIGYTLTAPG